MHQIVSDNRMRERISMKSKMLGALALLTLIGALFVMQSADQYTPTADAATGSIDALNVGTCLTTDATVFKGDCDMLVKDLAGTENDWEVRAKKTQVTTLYATYAHDPKTASDEPRAILEDSDLLQISILDTGRDKRTGVLIRGASYAGVNDDTDSGDTVANFDDEAPGSLAAVIRADLDKDKLDYDTAADTDTSDTTADIVFNSEDSDGDGIEVYQGTGATASLIGDSGNFTLNFTRAGCDGDDNDGANPTCTDAGEKHWQFDPGDFDVDNGAIVRFYGCVSSDATTCANDTDADNNVLDPIEKLDELTVDEDRSNGEATGNTAPWLGVNASVPTGKDVIILAIYYETSEAENLVGGEKFYTCADGETLYYGKVGATESDAWRCDTTSTTDTKENKPATERGVDRVDYTSNEKSDNDALLVQVKSDGDDTTQQLWLKETDIFSGRYNGFVRLTDSNGDRKDSTSRNNWGHETKDAKDETKDNAAVLGVESGPVTVEYRDSDGKKQTLRIEIDNTPPAISVDSPANGSSSGDQTPDFAGTLEDGDSGLVDKSFRLVIDNDVDGDGKNDDFVLMKPNADNVSGPATGVTYNLQYTGYPTSDADTASPTFGVVPANDLYKLGDDSCDNQAKCYIESDEYDDGASRGTFDDSIRLDLQDGSKGDVDTRDKEFEIDFQAFVLDMAGNVGFSDSDPASPRFINDLGETDTTKQKPGNILGYYSAHIITLDEKDPVIDTDQTATGFYGRSNDKNIPDRYGVMVVFDGPIAKSSVSNNTFTVELDDESMASVVGVDVDKQYVFLKLASELASNATPTIDIAAGYKVEDNAGNETFGKEVDAFEANDGISPKLTVSFSGGSGSGTGSEGADSLTKDKITVHVSSDEMLQGAPKIIVACSSLRWNQDKDMTAKENEVDSKHDIDDFIANRNGTFTTEPTEKPVTTEPRVSNSKASGQTYGYTCGYDSNDDNFGDNFVLTKVSALARKGENWEYTWQNLSGAEQKLEDGMLTAVAFGRDRSKHGTDDSMENWGAASAEFTLDTVLKNPKEDGGGDLQPDPDGVSKEDRPFVLIEFAENTQVKLDSVELDNVEVASKFDQPQTNRFVYWPESLSKGEHEVNVEATDAAGNEQTFEFSFTVESRGKFLIELQAGWNAISVPADPVDTAIGSVFSDPAIETVIGWDTQGWRIAVRRDGVWESNHQYGALNEIRAKYGYWVKSSAFIDQPVALKGPISRNLSGSAPTLIGIDTNPGWNFVGVIDQEGDQTEGDDFGTSLMDSQDRSLTASEYLGTNYVRAYTWDPTFSRFETLLPKNTVKIGKGIWVYYPETGGIAP